MKNQLLWLAGLLALIVIGTFTAIHVSADDRSSDTIEPNRYAVINSRVLARTQTGNNSVPLDTVCRIDTVTGRVWVLQTEIHQQSDPRFTRAMWVPVTEITVMDLQQMQRHHRMQENNGFQFQIQ